ncbi:MAG: adenine phosphoribosyltransferase [Bacillota bacterium]|nr:MAG: adenine phosphoribosyltransferase [Bacillota bacterium]MBS3949297.1 adenine phosphoribosyltransferase [Peptococcaceae bacterium]
MSLADKIRALPDFPKPGILFRDITTLLKDGPAFKQSIDDLALMCADLEFDLIVAPEARGFIIGTPLAYSLGKGFVPVRKSGKLPGPTRRASYSLEYGEDHLEIHEDAIEPGSRVLVVDDLLATGGTIRSAVDLVEGLGGQVVGVLFLIELLELHGRDVLNGYPVHSLIKY